jgi:hypothetical protein
MADGVPDVDMHPPPKRDDPLEELRAIWNDIKAKTESVQRLFRRHSVSPPDSKTSRRLRLAESPWLWGAIGVVAGTAASLAGSYFLGWIFFFAWLGPCATVVLPTPSPSRDVR